MPTVLDISDPPDDEGSWETPWYKGRDASIDEGVEIDDSDIQRLAAQPGYYDGKKAPRNEGSEASADDAGVANAPAPPKPLPGKRRLSEGLSVTAGDLSALVEKLGYERASDSLYAGILICDAETGACRRLKLEIPLGSVRRKVVLELNRRIGRGGPSVAGGIDEVFGNIRQASNAIVKNVGLDKLRSMIRGVVSDDKFQGALKEGGTVFPPLGCTLSSIASTAKLVESYHAGDEKAIGALKIIADKARAGDPTAAQAAICINVINKAARGGISVPSQLGMIKSAVKAMRADNPDALDQLAKIDRLIHELIPCAPEDCQRVVVEWMNLVHPGQTPSAPHKGSSGSLSWYDQGQSALLKIVQKSRTPKKAGVAGMALRDIETGRNW